MAEMTEWEVGTTLRLPQWTRQEILVLIQGKREAKGKMGRDWAIELAVGTASMEPKWAMVSLLTRFVTVTINLEFKVSSYRIIIL